jgi:hypothetical protein
MLRRNDKGVPRRPQMICEDSQIHNAKHGQSVCSPIQIPIHTRIKTRLVLDKLGVRAFVTGECHDLSRAGPSSAPFLSG